MSPDTEMVGGVGGLIDAELPIRQLNVAQNGEKPISVLASPPWVNAWVGAAYIFVYILTLLAGWSSLAHVRMWWWAFLFVDTGCLCWLAYRLFNDPGSRMAVQLYPAGLAVFHLGRVREFPWPRVTEVRLVTPGTPAPFSLWHKLIRDDGEEFGFEDCWGPFREVVERQAQDRGIRLTYVEVTDSGWW